MPTVSDDRRCLYTTVDGRRCRSPRLEGGQAMCYFHSQSSQMKTVDASFALLGDAILPPEESLDSAAAVNAVLTRILRLVANGKLPARHAGALAYLCQLILATLPGMEREGAVEAAHPLGTDPEAVVAELAETLRGAFRTMGNSEPAPRGAEGPSRLPTGLDADTG